MKILVINWQDIRNPFGGGAEVHFHEVFKRLAARGHQVTLYCSTFPGAASEETIDGIRILREGNRNLFNFYVRRRYKKQFRQESYDVVVDDINKIPFYTPAFVREPLLGIVHHLFANSIFVEASLPAALYVNLAERCAMRMYRNIPMAVVSESTKNELISHGFRPSNIGLVYNAVDHDLYKPKSTMLNQTEAVRIGYLGRIKKYKSVDHLVRAFAIVIKELPKSTLTIVGDGDVRNELESLTRELGVEKNVQFTGHVSSQEKVRLLKSMDLVVNTSAKEGWGLTVIEANACGVPVVASNVQGLRDSVVDQSTGLLYEYGNIEQLAEKMLLLLRDESLRLRMAEEALRWAGTFTWDHSADAMERLLQIVIQSRNLD